MPGRSDLRASGTGGFRPDIACRRKDRARNAPSGACGDIHNRAASRAISENTRTSSRDLIERQHGRADAGIGAAPGMPHTTLVASSCAITAAGGDEVLGRACRRSPCRQDHRQDAALPDIDRAREQRIDRGLAKFTGGPSSSDRDIHAVAHDAHVAAARGEIDLPGLTVSPSTASTGAGAPRSGEGRARQDDHGMRENSCSRLSRRSAGGGAKSGPGDGSVTG